jgi:hypothetical protein
MQDLLIVIWDSLITFVRFRNGTITNIILAPSILASGAFALSTQISKKCPFPIISDSLTLLGAANCMFLPLVSTLIMERTPRYQRVMVSSLIAASRNCAHRDGGGRPGDSSLLDNTQARPGGRRPRPRGYQGPHSGISPGHAFRRPFCIIAAIFSATTRVVANGSDKGMVGL